MAAIPRVICEVPQTQEQLPAAPGPGCQVWTCCKAPRPEALAFLCGVSLRGADTSPPGLFHILQEACPE